MYLLDTNVISELRKQDKANQGVRHFMSTLSKEDKQGFLSVITIGELRRGVELIRARGDAPQAAILESWLENIISEFSKWILPFGIEEAQVWGKLRALHHENALDKQIAATAILYNLTLVTRNIKDFEKTGVKTFNPFT